MLRIRKNSSALILAFLMPLYNIVAQDCWQLRKNDSILLKAIYNKLTHKGILKNWDFSKPLDQIDPIRIKLDANGCKLQSLEISYLERPDYKDSIRFIGNKFPAELPQLTGLKRLVLYGLNLSDTIPQSLFNLVELNELDLSANKLSGSLDRRYNFFGDLTKLLLYENEFENINPSEFFNFSKLEILSLRQNKLNIPFPKEVNRLTTLKELYLGNNLIYGNIPEEIKSMRDLVVLSIPQNKMNGTIPKFIQDMPSLDRIYLYENEFDSIGTFNNLLRREIDITRNNMTFDDIVPFVNFQSQLNPSGLLWYAPQKDTISIEKTILLNPGEFYEMEVPFDRNMLTNRYEWKNQNIVQGRERKLQISQFTKSKEGRYQCVVTNQSLPNMRFLVYHHTLKCKPQVGYYTTEICDGNYLDLYKVRFDKNHTFDSILVPGLSHTGCDSLLYVNIKIKPKSNKEIYAKFCAGDSYELNQQIYFQPGVYQQILKNHVQCDSIITLHLDLRDRIKDNAIIKYDGGNGDGSIELNPSLGEPPYKFLWSNGSTQAKIVGLRKGTNYSVTITDNVNCRANYEYKISLTNNKQLSLSETHNLYPNPINRETKKLFIEFSGKSDIEEILRAGMFDIKGNYTPMRIKPGIDKIELLLDQALNSGIYYIQLIGPQKLYHYTLLAQ